MWGPSVMGGKIRIKGMYCSLVGGGEGIYCWIY